MLLVDGHGHVLSGCQKPQWDGGAAPVGRPLHGYRGIGTNPTGNGPMPNAKGAGRI